MRASVNLRASAAVGGIRTLLARRLFNPARLGGLTWATVRAVLVIGISFVVVFPLLVRMTLALRAVEDMMDLTVNWVPRNFTVVNFQIAMKHMGYLKSTAITTAIAAPRRDRSRGMYDDRLRICPFLAIRSSRFLFALVLLSLMVPPSVVMVPLFLNFRYFTSLACSRNPDST